MTGWNVRQDAECAEVCADFPQSVRDRILAESQTLVSRARRIHYSSCDMKSELTNSVSKVQHTDEVNGARGAYSVGAFFK